MVAKMPGMMAGLQVLGRTTSINVRKVLWAADEIGLSYTREDWGLPIRDPAVPEFLALNPNAQVPVLVDGDFVLWESNAIIAYLARKHGSPLLPADAAGQGTVEQWLYWQLGELNPQWGYAVYALLRKNPAYSDAAQIAASIGRWAVKMQILEGQLARTGAFACGDAFTLADIALGLSVHRWFMTPFERPDLPHVSRYYEALKQRPAGAKWMTAATP
ncbi:glutathione S-transferase family protein [Devosia sp.]|jgi:glutathione S-transferase|uniref:glutathione S-transferase family protein n=1 Tax=Devosia sp. TaxID=1871048 RepID=UPI0037C0261A